ncbi:cell division protein FtsA [Abyssisolibacter fermentans]|uniref:cell division protein FtsA n=1 Tax=Abyssisolibacter fermentans TaxID=1766203 RepID=UPI000B16ED58|nr:cell division FtsA domain-containing protein [Abyssisolibacter fermentans]
MDSIQNSYGGVDNENEVIFSLDIGTRSVIGIVGKYINNKFEILASEIKEHDKRNMYDGQIHDINGVVNICRAVKESLEEKLDIKLTKAAIAAAGRALKTQRIKIDRDFDISMEIDVRTIESLEMEAIQKAQEMIDKTNENDMKYYCVGYTISNYFLDGSFIDNLEGHRGNSVGVDVLATFLPHVVVDSLYTVMNRIGLDVMNMTLEPIAAINVAIKKNLRLLNLALIDIGAGTSDIAITKDGAITAYAMASIAGDEITEEIAKKYLLDFDTAEELKIKLTKQQTQKFTDIVGIEQELASEQILDNIEESIVKLAREISDKILEYNQKSPSAVFLIGGGSQIPRLAGFIAEFLQMPPERVVMRSSDIIQDIEELNEDLIGPSFITPIGIAITAGLTRDKDFLEVIVNDEKIKLFNSRKMKVSDALILIGYNPRKLIPQKGKDFRYYVNGKLYIAKSGFGEPAKVYVNDKPSNLDYSLKNGDIIKVTAATQGETAKVYLYDCININKKVNVNGKDISLIKAIKVNDNITRENVLLRDDDNIITEEIKFVFELLDSMELNKNSTVTYSNGVEVEKDGLLKENDVLLIDEVMPKKQNNNNCLYAIINGEEMKLEHNKEYLVFIDIFNYIDIDLSKPKGKLILNVNGVKADYYQRLFNGDNIEAFWETDEI